MQKPEGLKDLLDGGCWIFPFLIFFFIYLFIYFCVVTKAIWWVDEKTVTDAFYASIEILSEL